MPESSPLVLIIRLDAIGDALALTPMLAAFRAADVPVDVVLRAQNAEVFSSRAARRIYEAPFAMRSNARENLAAIDEFGATLRENRYTHVLVATEDPGGYRLARAIGAPNRIGFVNGWGKPFKTLWAKTILTQTVFRAAGLDARAPHECEVAFALARTLLGDARPTHDATRLRPLVLESAPNADPRVAMQITDKWERLEIAFTDVVELATQLRARGPVRFFAATAERAYADRFSQSAGVDVEFFNALEPWKEAIAAARALVAPDSGALHVAGMTGTPTVAIFPPIREFELQTARWSPWAAPYRIVKAEPGWPLRAVDALVELDSAVAPRQTIQPAVDERL
jgi:ADP-heptose:LPS heptosyltransferase